MKTGTLSVFKHYGWLGKDEGGAQASMDIAAIENGKAVIDSEYWSLHADTHTLIQHLTTHLQEQAVLGIPGTVTQHLTTHLQQQAVLGTPGSVTVTAGFPRYI